MVEKSKELKEKEQKILSNKTQSIYALALLTGFCIVINIIFSFVNFKIDLTEEKRFTLTPSTVQMLNGLKDNIYVEVLLEGQFPAGFKRLQESTKDLLDQFRSESPYIQYRFFDPLALVTVAEKNNRIKDLAEDGIKPTNLREIGRAHV